jgi:hypothetical protein
MSESDARSRDEQPSWLRRIGGSLLLLALLGLLGVIGAAFLPRWWAQRIGDQVQGSITAGVLAGLFYGFVFTVLPLAVLWLAFRVFGSWKARAVAFAVAALVAAPNLLTLGIVLGEGSGAHAGDRILDVEAPAFRGATLTGALTALALLGVASYLVASRRRAWWRADRLEAEARSRDEATPKEPLL